MLVLLTMGTVFGLSAGLSPGPLSTLIISETLQHNTRAGIKVACAPLLTDLPIVVLSIWIVDSLATLNGALGMIALMGGAFVAYLGMKTWQIQSLGPASANVKSRSLVKGIVVNVLNPHPYIFWLSIGAPTVIKAMHQNLFSTLLFIIPFYGSLIGSKILIAFLAGKSKSFLSGKSYLIIMKILGFLLILFAIILFHEGAKLLNWI